ncbi:TPA: LPXTG cell wall anchor domain-containing protein [Streptococcus suis]
MKRSSGKKQLVKWSKLGLGLAAVTVLGGVVAPAGSQLPSAPALVYAEEVNYIIAIDAYLDGEYLYVIEDHPRYRRMSLPTSAADLNIKEYDPLYGKTLTSLKLVKHTEVPNENGRTEIYFGEAHFVSTPAETQPTASSSSTSQSSASKPSETSDVAPADKPVEPLVEPSVSRPAETPVEQPVEQPVEIPVAPQPAETSVVTPADKSSETLIDPSVSKPAETPSAPQPAETSVVTPADKPVEPLVEPSASKPAETPSETPAKSLAETPTNVQPSADQAGQSATEPTVLSKQDSQAGTASPTGQSAQGKQETKQETKEQAAPASQSKQATVKPAPTSQPQAKSLPATGEAHSVLHMTGMGLLGLAGLVVKRRSRKSS